MIALLLGLVPAVADAAADSKALLEKFLAESMAPYGTSSSEETPELEKLLYDWAKAGADRASLQAQTEKKFGLPRELAVRLVDLTLERGANGSDYTPESTASYLALARKYPAVELAFVEAAMAIDQHGFDDCDPVIFEPLLELRADKDVARRLIYENTYCLGLLTEQTTMRPGEAEPYYRLAEESKNFSEGWLIFAAQRIADAKAVADPALPESRRTNLRKLRFESELGEARYTDIAEMLPGSPADHAALANQFDRSTKAAVVAALLLAGDKEKARAWRALVPGPIAAPPGESAYERTRREAQDWVVQLLDVALAEPPRDDFLFFARWFKYESNVGYPEVWQRLLSRVADGQGYPGFKERDYDRGGTSELEEALQRCVRCAPELVAMIHTIAESVSKADAREPVSGLSPDVLLNVERVMAMPRPAWREQPLPPAQRSVRKPNKDSKEPDLLAMLAGEGSREDPKEAWVSRLPKGVLVRYEKQGRRLVAITASQSLDPTGEISSGGYWLSLSEDGGEHFSAPLYTGLRMYEPYVVLPKSKLPMLDGDRVRLEVAVRKLDGEHVILPPVFIPFLEQRDNVYLEASLGEIARDSDLDGLSDLAEWGMLLAPDLADTDGDGIPDGRDPLPHVAGNKSIRGADAMAFALNQMMGKSLGALVTTDATGEPGRTSIGGPDTDLYHADSTQFMLAPPAYFAGMSLKRRLLVLDDRLLEKLSQSRGTSFAMGISNFEVSRDGNSAVMKWSTGWAGGAMLLTRKGDGWDIEQLASWIT